MESSIHHLAKPDVLPLLALARPPVLAWDAVRSGVDAALADLHVAEDLDGVDCGALVRVDPIFT